ncbi:MAG TPA: DUF134 domain-containing protein [Exilispira sp.]|nr:DUF134 domain-containing protein [Exilispira sp.]
MPRCKKKRFCRFLDNEKIYKPIGYPMHNLEIVEIEIDEFESIRLCDFENLSQIEAADKMRISRGTVQRLLEKARYKILDALINNKIIRIKKS